MHQSLLILLFLVPFLAAPLTVAAAARSRSLAAWTAGAGMLAGLAILVPLALEVTQGRTVILRALWLPEWGLDFALRFDGLSLLFGLLIFGIGLLIVLYAAYYMAQDDRLGRFYGLLLAFAGGMLGVVLAENILLMLVFWEVTSLTSFLLIAYKSYAKDARIAARMALAITGGGGLALLAGLLLLGHIAGSYELSDILARGDEVRAHRLYDVMLLLILLGAFTKSAQFPFHFWLPNAMAAPTPVSAYLHSATMVKAGVFLLARLYPALSGTDLWMLLVGATGAITFIYGAYVALLKHDFKSLLAYSTISHLGLITLLFGMSTPMSAVAAVFHIINHAIFKASLFMSAGIIDHECGTRDMRRINGLFKYMPRTAILGMLAAGAMAGVPLLNGFLSKEMFFAETVDHPLFEGYLAYLVPAFATIAGALSVAYSMRFVHDVFFNGEPVDLPRSPKEPPRWMRLPVEILVALVLIVGLLPQLSVGALLKTAADAVIPGGAPAFKLTVWHGFNMPLAMSVVALAFGLLHYWRRQHLFALHERYSRPISTSVAFERVYRDAGRISEWTLSVLDDGSARRYLLAFILFTIGLGFWAFSAGPPSSLTGPLTPMPPQWPALLALLILAIGTLGTLLNHRERLTAVIFMSVVGLIVALTFVHLEAPDLALTQLSVEVVTIVLLLLSLRFLPGIGQNEVSRARPALDAGIALAGGLGAAALTFAMLTRPFETISGYHIANSVPGGGGTNVVNVTLVDFRGFDTLGEIAVLAMAALGVAALLAGLHLKPHVQDPTNETDRHPILLAMLMRPLLPLALAVSAYIFLRGHNMPGGGFIAGLIAAVAFILQYIASGIDFATERLRVNYRRLMGIGLAIAVATGAVSMALGYPFLTSTFTYVYPPVIEKFEVASAMAFDLGVFLVVAGAVLLTLSELGFLSRREVQPATVETMTGDQR